MQENNLFRPNGLSVFALGLLDSTISKILTFSYTLLSAGVILGNKGMRAV